MKNLTIEQKEQELRNINFFVGGLTNEIQQELNSCSKIE